MADFRQVGAAAWRAQSRDYWRCGGRGVIDMGRLDVCGRHINFFFPSQITKFKLSFFIIFRPSFFSNHHHISAFISYFRLSFLSYVRLSFFYILGFFFFKIILGFLFNHIFLGFYLIFQAFFGCAGAPVVCERHQEMAVDFAIGGGGAI